MIKQNSTKSVEAVVTPAAFFRESAEIAETPSYDWNTQRNSIMGFGTFRKTFGGSMETWETD